LNDGQKNNSYHLTMENRDGNDSRGIKSEIENSLKHHDRNAQATLERHGTPKKRRKVNHGKSFPKPSPFGVLYLVYLLPCLAFAACRCGGKHPDKVGS
jgi:hypothetical protein